MQRLIAVGLGCGDIVLEAVGYGLEDIVDYAENVITFYDGLYYYSHRVNVVYLVYLLALHVELLVYAVDALDPALDYRRGLYVAYALAYAALYYVYEGVALLTVEV